MPKWEHKERQARLRFLCQVSPILNFLHSRDDRFAAQIDLFLLRALRRYGGQGGGALPAYGPFTVLSGFLSFQFTG